jgi:hypothetical protein
VKHWETHPEYVDGCYGCKLTTVTADAGSFSRERSGDGPTSGMGTREYVKDMFESRRAAGREDPVPENRKAAAFAPGKGVFRKATGV